VSNDIFDPEIAATARNEKTYTSSSMDCYAYLLSMIRAVSTLFGCLD
jgi:hypothetical protein